MLTFPSLLLKRNNNKTYGHNKNIMVLNEVRYDRHNPGNVPPPSKPEDFIFGKTNKSYGMKVNITI